MRRRVWAAGLGVILVLAPMAPSAQQPDWTPIEYPDGTGCGLYVEFVTADGWDPIVNGKPTAFFPGGAPPSTSEAECLARCREWAGSAIVRSLAADYRKSVFITQVRGTCYLRRAALGSPRLIELP
jgi:hypothetical protein